MTQLAAKIKAGYGQHSDTKKFHGHIEIQTYDDPPQRRYCAHARDTAAEAIADAKEFAKEIADSVKAKYQDRVEVKEQHIPDGKPFKEVH